MAREGDRRGSLRNEGAVGQAIAFIATAAVLSGTLFIATELADDAGVQTARVDAAKQGVQAEDIAKVLINAGGVQSDASAALGGLGLGLLDSDGMGLARDAVIQLGLAELLADPDNGLPDYAELHNAMGLDERDGSSTEFRLETRPKGHAFVDTSGLRAAYIGQWNSGSVSGTLAFGAYAIGDPDDMNAKMQAQLDFWMSSIAMQERDLLLQTDTNFHDDLYLDETMTGLLAETLPGVTTPLFADLEVASFEGDVYPDDPTYLETTLTLKLDEYDLLVVGSGVDSQALNGDILKQAIRDWVQDDGTIMVTAPDNGNKAWLTPLISASANPSNDATTGNGKHAILNKPNQVDWDDYDADGKSWNIGSSDVDDFQNVVKMGGDTAFSVSRPQAHGVGPIILTSFSLAGIASDISEEEALDFMENILAYLATGELKITYGPEVPDDTMVSTALRLVSVEDDRFGSIPVEFRVFVWYT